MAKLLRPVLVSASLLALSACATAGPPPVAGAPAPRPSVATESSSVYGYYLAGQVAAGSGDSQAAAEFYQRAHAADPATNFVGEQLFTSTLLAGDVTRAAALAPAAGEAAPATRALGLLTQAVEAMAEGRNAEAQARLNEPDATAVNPAPVQLLRPWVAAAMGHWSDALATPSTGDRIVKLVAGLGQAQLFERARRYPEAETAFNALLADKAGQAFVTPAYGLFLERRGRRAEAIAAYDQVLADAPDDVSVAAARARAVAKGTPPPQLSLREGAAQALMVPTAIVLADKQPDLGLIYLHLILRLDPRKDDALLLEGDVVGSTGNTEDSRAAYLQIGPKSPRYADARERLVWSYQADDKITALKVARETVAQLPTNDEAKLTLADVLRADERFEESARVLDPLILAAGADADWRLYYMRAVALERSGRWPDAERDLTRALSIKPDQPEILNYLGYSWVNRGQKLKEGLEMIQKAVDAQPEEGAYVDSLGWAYFRLGDYPNAISTLERAVSLDASDAEINDHLGDAYWRGGRHDEARFQWSAVLSLSPSPDIKARCEAKLASSLGPDVEIKPAAVASQ